MQVIVAQDRGGDIVGHPRQQRLAVIGRQHARHDRAIEQDLDVDLVIRGVDAGRIVDRIGIDAAAGERVSDAPALGHAEIGAFADYFRADFVAVDAQRIVGAVADRGMALVRPLDEGADAAEPQQIDGCGQQFADQLGRGQLVRRDGEERASSAG